jgi:hypothetical protein
LAGRGGGTGWPNIRIPDLYQKQNYLVYSYSSKSGGKTEQRSYLASYKNIWIGEVLVLQLPDLTLLAPVEERQFLLSHHGQGAHAHALPVGYNSQ